MSKFFADDGLLDHLPSDGHRTAVRPSDGRPTVVGRPSDGRFRSLFLICFGILNLLRGSITGLAIELK